MDLRTRSGLGQRLYEDFEPRFELVREEGSDTLQLLIPGFRKEQIKVQLDNSGKLRISGERLVDGNRWRRFRKDFQVPENCNSAELNAKFENGILYVIMPKLITQVQPKEQLKPAQETPASRKPEVESKPANDLPKTSQIATPIAEKPAENKTAERVDARKDTENMAVKDEERSVKAPTRVISEKKEGDKKISSEVKQEEERGKALARVTSEKKEIHKKISSEVKQEEKKDGVSFDTKDTSKGTRMAGHIERVPEMSKNGAEGVGSNQSIQLLVNVAVAAMVIVALGFYASYRSN